MYAVSLEQDAQRPGLLLAREVRLQALHLEVVRQLRHLRESNLGDARLGRCRANSPSFVDLLGRGQKQSCGESLICWCGGLFSCFPMLG